MEPLIFCLVPFLLNVNLASADETEISYQASASCSASHQAAVWGAMVACQPRPTLVEVPLPAGAAADAGAVMSVIPGHVMVDRCSGSCHSPSHSCLPVSAVNTSVEVMAVRTTYATGQWETLCTSVLVEKHTACACSCREKAEHCHPTLQFYDAPSCQCRCNDREAERECVAAGKEWDTRTCQCLCPQRTWRACSTGFAFDYRGSCECVRTFALAAGGLAVVVAVTALTALGLSFVVFHLRRRQKMASRRSSITHKAIVEAFVEQGSSGS